MYHSHLFSHANSNAVLLLLFLCVAQYSARGDSRFMSSNLHSRTYKFGCVCVWALHVCVQLHKLPTLLSRNGVCAAALIDNVSFLADLVALKPFDFSLYTQTHTRTHKKPRTQTLQWLSRRHFFSTLVFVLIFFFFLRLFERTLAWPASCLGPLLCLINISNIFGIPKRKEENSYKLFLRHFNQKKKCCTLTQGTTIRMNEGSGG